MVIAADPRNVHQDPPQATSTPQTYKGKGKGKGKSSRKNANNQSPPEERRRELSDDDVEVPEQRKSFVMIKTLFFNELRRLGIENDLLEIDM